MKQLRFLWQTAFLQMKPGVSGPYEEHPMASRTRKHVTTLALAACAGSVLAQPAVEDELGMLTKSDPLVADLGFTFDTLGSDFDTEIAIWTLDGTLRANNDDAVPGAVFQSSISYLAPPGVYYISVSGYDTVFGNNFQAATFTDSDGGNITGKIELIQNGSQVINFDTTIQAGDFGSTPGEVKYYRFQIPGLFEHQDLGTVSYDGFVEIDTCGSNFDTEIGVWNLDTGELIDFNDDAADNGGGSACDGSLQSYLSMRLPTGRYALSVSGFGTEFDEGFAAITTNNSNSGNMTGSVNGVGIADTVSAGGEVEWYTFDVVALPAGALSDGEPDCFPGYVDTTNGGCFNGGDFGSLSLGQTINGSAGPVEQDWYEVVITETSGYTLSIESETEVAFGFAAQTVSGVPGCANVLPFISGQTALAFTPMSFSGTLNPGTYYIEVFGTTNSECGGDYTLSFRPQIPDCPPGSYQEQEPVPFDNFVSLAGGTNDACLYGSLSPEDVSLGDTICGTTGTYYENSFAENFGDVDTYRYTLTEPTVVEAQVISASSLTMLGNTIPLPATDYCDIITGGRPAAYSTPGQTATLRHALQPGDYVFSVFNNPFAASGTASGTPYLLSINEYACKADTNLDGNVSPADFSAWVAAYNSQSVICDQNDDGVCSPADFSAWVSNYNVGCP